MTTETDLLPLPEWTKRDDLGGLVPSEVRVEMCAYARANVAHATAPLQAEIEALRAEVDEWKDAARCASEQQDRLFREARALNELADNLRAEVYFRDSVIATHAADTREYQKRISQAEARADKLAEALECMIIGACAVAVPHNGERAVLQDAVNIARAALAAYRKGGAQ